MHRTAFLFSLLTFSWQDTSAFSLERQNIAGIWKLHLDPASSLNKKSGSSIMIKLKEDGSFQQFDDEEKDDYLEGCWDFEDSQLQLAIDRRCLTSKADTLLSGKVSGGDETMARGEVSAGKFMYPTSHAAFFDQVMAASESVGKFSMKQVMAFSSVAMMMSSEKEEETTPNFQAEDFFGRQFVMTIVPIECKVKPQEVWDKDLKQWRSPLDDQAVDIRGLPIQFFANSTFQAIGINKVLRGRFEVSKDDKLRFHVSRFGMGRGVPGSVYSEGIGLSHEDERTYVGKIEAIGPSSLRVQGKVTFGADLGSDARPEPVGTFLLTEVSDASMDLVDDDNSPEAEDDIFNSVFE